MAEALSPPASPFPPGMFEPVVVPTSVNPRYAALYAQNARLQQVHAIYGRYIGQPRPSLTHPASAAPRDRNFQILVGDYFQMPQSPPGE